MRLIPMMVLAVALVMSACATPNTAQQSVFSAKQTYAAALTGAVAYKRLPNCDTSPQPCSDETVVVQLQKADLVAATALDAAEAAVRSPDFGKDIAATSLAAANAALSALLSILNTLVPAK